MPTTAVVASPCACQSRTETYCEACSETQTEHPSTDNHAIFERHHNLKDDHTLTIAKFRIGNHTEWIVFIDSQPLLSVDTTHATFDPVNDHPIEVSEMILSDLIQVATGKGNPPPA